jgi:adenosylmethionine-8-amino-7-oxononanoate aminotransferase
VREARAQGVIIRPLGNTIVLMPPLAIAIDELERLVDVARDAIVVATA